MPSNKSVKRNVQVKMKQQQTTSKKKSLLKTTSENSISETISFVIKGKLTPIKPSFVTKKILKSDNRKLRTKTNDTTRKKTLNRRKTPNLPPRKLRNTPINVLVKEKNNKMVGKQKNIKKILKNNKEETKLKVKKPQEIGTRSRNIDEIKKKKTIAKLLKEANKVLKQPLKTKKLRINTKPKNNKKANNDKKEQSDDEIKKETKINIQPKKTQISNNKEDSSTSDDNNLEEIRQAIKKETTTTTTVKKKNEKLNKNNKIIKKTNRTTKKKQLEEKMRKLRMLGLWNAPKRQRVASLNALAKVHCLYENEGRMSLLDNTDDIQIKKEIIEKNENSDSEETSDPPPPQRTLRYVQRGAGKYWDMHNATSSSSDDETTDNEEIIINKKKIKIKKEPKTTPTIKKSNKEEKNKKPTTTTTTRKKKQNEIIMDLKDMVVRKRMASLNATAILAASYSQEKRSPKSPKSEVTSTTTTDTDGSDDDFINEDDNLRKKCYEDDVKKEDKIIEVHTKPNKKVAVILNQDTDVTITGVYVNSTTRSTHHEGYCSIAGMQYRISATSHTQTAATAVATETLLQSSSTSSTQENSNTETLTPTGKSYKPLDALSNMCPPNDGHQSMGPPQHIMPLSPTGVRHSCTSAFSAPNSYHHHTGPQTSGEPGYIHGYYQPAGPLITVPLSHGQPPLAKSAPLSEISPTTPSPLSSHPQHPAPSSNNGDSSDSEVIITSVTAGKDNPLPPQAHSSYRYSQYPPNVPPSYSYPYSSHYYHPTPPPPPSYPPHDVCYSPGPYVHHKFPPATYRRYLGGPQYYTPNPPPPTQDIYAVPPTHAQPSQQVVTTTPVSGSGTPYQPTVGPPPPSTLMEPYPPTLVETYPTHYYPGYPPGPSACYSHAPPPRAVPFLNGAYQSCPCPMQSCPKNGLTGPLTGDSKRSSTLPKGNMPPLPPVALALPKEPTSDGPPSPARGSAGMPPPPSPAGAMYQQQPTPPTKQESISPENEIPIEKKRKARVGKAMVRNNIQNTMLLMCNPIPPNCVKREIESPKEKEIVTVPQVQEISLNHNVIETSQFESIVPQTFEEKLTSSPEHHKIILEQPSIKIEEKSLETLKKEEPELLEPVISTVGENVKVKNMKRKLSLSIERKEETPSSPIKKLKTETNLNGSYKNLIKKNTSSIRINNGRRKLIQESKIPHKLLSRATVLKRRNAQNKRKLSSSRESVNTKRKKLKCFKTAKNKALLTINNNNYNKTNCEINIDEKLIDESIESKENIKRGNVTQLNVKSNNKLAPTLLDKLIAKNNVDRTIECVIGDAIRTKKIDKIKQIKEPLVPTSVCVKKNTKRTSNRRKSKCKDTIVSVNLPKSLPPPLRWSNGWNWEGDPYEAKVFLNSDETTVIRKCYPCMKHDSGDLIEVKDCVLLKAGARKNELPFVAKIAALWENPDDGEMMMSLLWYYRPEHTEQGRLPNDQPDEVFASRHKDSNSVACIDDKCFVLTYNEYCRYRKHLRRLDEGIDENISPCIPVPEPYSRSHRQPPKDLKISPEMVFFCRRVYDFRQKRIVKNPT